MTLLLDPVKIIKINHNIEKHMTDIAFIDPTLQPRPEDFNFDLRKALSSIIGVRVNVPENAFTAPSLGVERAGHGVMIEETGLILTIGYLTIEAQTIWLIDGTGKAVPGHVLGYDQESGFGLIHALNPLNAGAIKIGSSSQTEIGDTVLLAGAGGVKSTVKAAIAEKREFAGYWEYLLNEAIFTTPPHPFWGGAGLISKTGDLIGIGSLFVQQNHEDGSPFDGNMIVPIDLLSPILDDLLKFGRVNKSARPWLGTMVAEAPGTLVIAGLIPGGPGETAGLEPGDNVNAIEGKPTENLASFLRQLWSLGDAGIGVTLTIMREQDLLDIKIKSADRNAYLIQPNVH